MSTLASVNGRGANASRPAAGIAGALYLSTDIGPGTWYRDNGSSWDAMATSNPMTTSQDTIVGGASGAPGRLAAGAAGAAYSMLNSVVAWNAGTSMPGSKATNDRYYRTDLGPGLPVEYYWDGTRWLSKQLFREPITAQDSLAPASATIGGWYLPLWNGDQDVYLVDFRVTTFVLTTNNSTNFWTVAVRRNPSATSLGSFSTGTTPDATGSGIKHKVSINALTGTTDTYLDLLLTKTLSPGNIYVMPTITYRLVGT